MSTNYLRVILSDKYIQLIFSTLVRFNFFGILDGQNKKTMRKPARRTNENICFFNYLFDSKNLNVINKV